MLDGDADQGHGAEEWNARLTSLMNVGLAYAEAALWADLDARCSTRYLTLCAADYRDLGFEAADAIAWHTRGIDSLTARDFAVNGWTPRSFDALHDTLRMQAHHLEKAEAMAVVLSALDWAISGIPRPLTLLYIRGGFGLREARRLEALRRGGAPIEDTLRFLSALGGS